jgi:hypothetical protein
MENHTPMTPPKRYTITIYKVTDSNGNTTLEYISEDEASSWHRPGRSIKVPTNAKIRWTSNDGDFSVNFGSHSPFQSACGSLEASQGDATRYETLTISDRRQVFKYTARVDDLTEDPEIIVDDSG